jgi:hypothetical protein
VWRSKQGYHLTRVDVERKAIEDGDQRACWVGEHYAYELYPPLKIGWRHMAGGRDFWNAPYERDHFVCCPNSCR